MSPIRSNEILLAHLEAGAKPKFVFFWGHAPSKDGTISKSCFSQWWEASFEIDGVRCLTAEHFMMASKARLFADDAALARILESTHPKQAKDLGRSVVDFDETTWLEHRFDLVVKGNEAKFRQNKLLADYLIATGDRVLVEASPVDRIWGIGLAADDVKATAPAKWRGLNLLGYALMEVRERISA